MEKKALVDEVTAALAASRELGSTYEREIAESIVERLEDAIDRKIEDRLANGRRIPIKDSAEAVSFTHLYAASVGAVAVSPLALYMVEADYWVSVIIWLASILVCIGVGIKLVRSRNKK